MEKINFRNLTVCKYVDYGFLVAKRSMTMDQENK